MKKIIFILLISVISVSVHAQLAKTKWNGTINGDAAQKAVFKFGKDSLVLYATDGKVIETMHYSVKNGILSVYKLSGQSDCDGTTFGQYKFAIKDDVMRLTAVSDVCSDRLDALDKTVWKKG